MKHLLPEKDIIEFYINKIQSVKELSNIYNVAPNTIRRILYKHNIPALQAQKEDYKLSSTEISSIIEIYKTHNFSVRELAKQFNSSHTTISKILKLNNILVKQINIIQPNSDFILSDSDEKYYFFGFLLGDGNLSKKNNIYTMEVTLANKDKIILEKFCNYLSYPINRITERTKQLKNKIGVYNRLSISNKIWNNDYSNLGFVENKTYNPSILNIKNNYIKPFIIGYTDADGSVIFGKKSRHTFSIIGHPQNIDWTIDNLRKLNIKTDIRTCVVNNKWKRLIISNKKGVIEVAECLDIKKYYPLILERKWKDVYNYLYK